MKKMILLDAMNSYFICFAIAKKLIEEEKGREITQEDVPFFFHVLFNKLHNIFSTYGEVVICNEGMKSLEWRRNIFKDYKRNRDAHKATEEYKVFRSTLDKIDEVLHYYPTKFLKIDPAEADDIIAVLSEKYSQDHEITIISSDGDLTQLINYYPNIVQYNPIKQMYVKPKHKFIAEEKAIVGDRSDNICGIPRIGIKTFEKMIEDRNFFHEKMKNGNREIYEKFLSIIDLRKIPKEIKGEILDKDLKTEYNKFDPESAEAFFMENKCGKILESFGRLRDDINLRLRNE
jgi:5'-3' exonuclease